MDTRDRQTSPEELTSSQYPNLNKISTREGRVREEREYEGERRERRRDEGGKGEEEGQTLFRRLMRILFRRRRKRLLFQW